MRILGNIEHPQMKITVFQMNGRISIKFEGALLEQTYKFRDLDYLQTMEDVTKLVDSSFLDGVLNNMLLMQKAGHQALERIITVEEADMFDVII